MLQNKACMVCGSDKLQLNEVSMTSRPNPMYTGMSSAPMEEIVTVTRKFMCTKCYARIEINYEGSKKENFDD